MKGKEIVSSEPGVSVAEFSRLRAYRAKLVPARQAA